MPVGPGDHRGAAAEDRVAGEQGVVGGQDEGAGVGRVPGVATTRRARGRRRVIDLAVADVVVPAAEGPHRGPGQLGKRSADSAWSRWPCVSSVRATRGTVRIDVVQHPRQVSLVERSGSMTTASVEPGSSEDPGVGAVEGHRRRGWAPARTCARVWPGPPTQCSATGRRPSPAAASMRDAPGRRASTVGTGMTGATGGCSAMNARRARRRCRSPRRCTTVGGSMEAPQRHTGRQQGPRRRSPSRRSSASLVWPSALWSAGIGAAKNHVS